MTPGELAHFIVNTPGIGGAIVLIVITIAIATYISLARWILKGGTEENERRPQRRSR